MTNPTPNMQAVQVADGPERRTIFGSLELREVGEQRFLSGITAPFNKLSEDLGWFVEEIQPGAFRDALATSDVAALFNHNPDNLLGRSSAGTLQIEERAAGLWYETLLPNTTVGQTVREGVTRRDIQGNSFAFKVPEEGGDVWQPLPDGRLRRTIIKIERLFDVGPVVYPAYQDTSVSLRAIQQMEREGHLNRAIRERIQAHLLA